MELLYILLVLLFVTRLFGELSVRFGQPALAGELVSGIILGVIARHYSTTFPLLAHLPENPVFQGLTDLAIFFLMLLAGLEMQPGDLVKVAGSSFMVALGGVIVPLIAGAALAWWFIPESTFKVPQTLFLATSLAVTAVPVAIKVLMDLGQLTSRIGRVIVGAALIDDVIGLLLLAVLTGMIGTGSASVNLVSVAILMAKILLFFGIATFSGVYIFPTISRHFQFLRTDEVDFTALLLVALAFSILAESLGLHFILGAFMTALFFGRMTSDSSTYNVVKAKVSGITSGFLAPLFFASIGMRLNLEALDQVPMFVVALILTAMLSKLLGSGLPAYWLRYSKKDSLAIGTAMSARGAVELIIAEIALGAGLFLKPKPTPAVVSNLFSSVVIMALVTTLLTPILLRWIIGKTSKTATRT